MHGLQVTAVLARQILLGKLQLELPLSVSFSGAASQSGNLQINKTTHFYQDINLQHVLHMQHWICISLTELKHKSTCHNSTCLCSTTDCSICMYVTWDCSITLLHAHLIHRQLPHVLLHPGGGQPWRCPAVPLAHGLRWPLHWGVSASVHFSQANVSVVTTNTCHLSLLIILLLTVRCLVCSPSSWAHVNKTQTLTLALDYVEWNGLLSSFLWLTSLRSRLHNNWQHLRCEVWVWIYFRTE